MTERPRIGVTASDRGAVTTWLAQSLAVVRAGGRPVRLTAGGRTDADGLDGLVIGGGDDIGAELYGGEVALDVRVDAQRDDMERRVLDTALHGGLPVLGVCRGAQMINVHLGGTLHQDVHDAYRNLPRLRTPLARKRITLAAGSRLARLMGGGRIAVNSLHHQAVKSLGEGLRVSARDAHRVVQAIEHASERFLFGVQWHPELLPFRRRHQALYRGLVRAARAAAGG